jgi:transmembrane protein TMEM260 (protein O-mannosyltransferase)
MDRRGELPAQRVFPPRRRLTSSEAKAQVGSGSAWVDAGLVLALGFVLYLSCLAPTVLWGDDAELQRLVGSGGEINPGRGHLLWLVIGRAFDALPWGDPAGRANLVSAVFGALTLPLVYACVFILTRRREAAWLGAGALAVSHTFWLHAVRAEVYTLHTFFLAGAAAAALAWAKAPERSGRLFLAAFLMGFALGNHVLMLTSAPALAWLVWRVGARHGRREARWASPALAIAAGALGAAPYLALVLPHAVGDPLARPLSVLDPLSISGWEAARASAYFVYQFPLGLVLAVPGAVDLWKRERASAEFLIIALASAAGFALSFHVRDQYVFFLPAYVILSILIGAGAAKLLEGGEAATSDAEPGRRTGARFVSSILARRAGLVLALLAAPPLLYLSATPLSNALGASLVGLRILPGRDARFFLWPPKTGYVAARRFAEEAFAAVPEGGLILADWTPAQPLLYLQAVEGRRPDVTVKTLGAGWGLQAAYLIDQSAARPVFIAGIGDYFDMEEIGRSFDVRPAGPIYRLEPKGPPR